LKLLKAEPIISDLAQGPGVQISNKTAALHGIRPGSLHWFFINRERDRMSRISGQVKKDTDESWEAGRLEGWEAWSKGER